MLLASLETLRSHPDFPTEFPARLNFLHVNDGDFPACDDSHAYHSEFPALDTVNRHPVREVLRVHRVLRFVLVVVSVSTLVI